MILDIIIIILFFVLKIPLPYLIDDFPLSDLMYRFVADIIFIIMLLILLKIRRNPDSSRSLASNLLGWNRCSFAQIALGIGGAIILFALSLSIIQFLPQKQIYNGSFNLYPYGTYILLLVAGIAEELFYRSFIMKKLLDTGKLSPISVILFSSFFFAMGHIYLGLGGFIFSVISGIFLAFLLIRYKSITVVIIAHVLYNLVFYTMHLFDSSI